MFSGTMDVSAPLPTDPFATMRTWSHRALAFTQSERFGNAVIILFFVSQALDGALTYLGVTILGRDVEGNPLLHWRSDGGAFSEPDRPGLGVTIRADFVDEYRIVAASRGGLEGDR